MLKILNYLFHLLHYPNSFWVVWHISVFHMDTSWWQSCQLLRFYDSLSFFEGCISFLGRILLFLRSPFLSISFALVDTVQWDFFLWKLAARALASIKIFLEGLDVYRLSEMKSEPWNIIKIWNPFAKKTKVLLVIVLKIAKKKKSVYISKRLKQHTKQVAVGNVLENRILGALEM